MRKIHPSMYDNPGLEPFDISEYRGVHGENFYEEDTIFRRIIERHKRELSTDHGHDMERHLNTYGELVGGILDDLTIASHKEGKYGELIQYDRAGNRIDEIRYCAEQLQSREISYKHGIVNLDFHDGWKHPFTLLHRMGLAYIANMNGEGGMTCPLAMTDGMIQVLKALGTDEQKELYLPLVAGPNSHSHFMCGQYVTERVGGSNVAANRTVARKGENGKYYLTGEKWFCSNPGDLWVTTARIENSSTIGLFLVPRLTENGDLNGVFHTRKKEIIGSKGKLTCEVIYDNCEAEPLGRTSHGLANLIKYVIRVSRLHVAVASLGMGRRAFMEARAYTRVREAYGKRISEIPVVQRTLSEMQILQSAITLGVFRNYDMVEKNNILESLLTPIQKYATTTHGTWIQHQAMLLHGGNGILEDFSVLPRLLNDCIINETWEGNHSLLAEHAVKAFGRKKVQEAFERLLDDDYDSAATSRKHQEKLVNLASHARKLYEQALHLVSEDKMLVDMNRMVICDYIHHAFLLSTMIREAAEDSEGTMLWFAEGLSEIYDRGVLGPAKPDGIFHDTEVMKLIVNY